MDKPQPIEHKVSRRVKTYKCGACEHDHPETGLGKCMLCGETDSIAQLWAINETETAFIEVRACRACTRGFFAQEIASRIKDMANVQLSVLPEPFNEQNSPAHLQVLLSILETVEHFGRFINQDMTVPAMALATVFDGLRNGEDPATIQRRLEDVAKWDRGDIDPDDFIGPPDIAA